MISRTGIKRDSTKINVKNSYKKREKNFRSKEKLMNRYIISIHLYGKEQKRSDEEETEL